MDTVVSEKNSQHILVIYAVINIFQLKALSTNEHFTCNCKRKSWSIVHMVCEGMCASSGKIEMTKQLN